MADGKPTIDISKNGPLLVKGLKKLADAEGNTTTPATAPTTATSAERVATAQLRPVILLV